jgi:hypothetical protein
MSNYAIAGQLDVKQRSFTKEDEAIPLAGKYGSFNAIGNYLIPPKSGTHILGAIDGEIQWIETVDCGATGATGP